MRHALPPDIFMEILIWTDIESLPLLRWVSKEWRRLISHPYFVNRHHQKTKTVCGYIADKTYSSFGIDFFPHPSVPLSEPLPSLTFLKEPVKIHASSPHGLLLCFSLASQCYYVCKPTTQEYATIPSPDPKKFTVRIAMSVTTINPLRFMIMRICRPRQKIIQYECEVFDSDSCGGWKVIEGAGLLLGSNLYTTACVLDGVVVNGSFLWIDRKGDYEVTKIMSVDLWAEEVKTIELPQEVVAKDVSAKMVNKLSNLHRGLGLIHWGRDYIYEFWAMTSMVEQRWEKLHVLDLSQNDPIATFSFGWITTHISDNTVLVNRNSFGNGIFWYNLKEDKFIETRVGHAHNVFIRDLYFFESDYFPCNISKCQYNKFLIEHGRHSV